MIAEKVMDFKVIDQTIPTKETMKTMKTKDYTETNEELHARIAQLGPGIDDEYAASHAASLLQESHSETSYAGRSFQTASGTTTSDKDTHYFDMEDAAELEKTGPRVDDEEISTYMNQFLG